MAELETIEIWFTKGGKIRRPRVTKFVVDGKDLTAMVTVLNDVGITREPSSDLARVHVALVGRVIVNEEA